MRRGCRKWGRCGSLWPAVINSICWFARRCESEVPSVCVGQTSWKTHEFLAFPVKHERRKYWFTGVEAYFDTNHIHYRPFPARLVFTFPLSEVWGKTSASLSAEVLLWFCCFTSCRGSHLMLFGQMITRQKASDWTVGRAEAIRFKVNTTQVKWTLHNW